MALIPLRGLGQCARLCAGVLLLAWLGGCAVLIPQTEALREGRPAELPEQVELAHVPFFPQKDYQCGPAALATLLADADVAVTPDELVDQVYLPERKGSLQLEMLAAGRRYGMVSYELAPRFEDVLREVAAGTPVIVLQNYGVGPFPIWHYAVVVGYDYPRGEVILRSGEKERLVMPFGVFEYVWKDSGYWAMVAVPPDRVPVTAEESGYLTAITAMERVGDTAAAGKAYGAFLARWPGNAVAALGLANTQYASGDRIGAEATLCSAAERNPDSVPILNNLAHVLSDGGHHDEAMVVIERARALGGPLSATVEQTRTEILERAGTGAAAPAVKRRGEGTRTPVAGRRDRRAESCGVTMMPVSAPAPRTSSGRRPPA